MSVCDVPVISSVCDFVGEGTASLIAAPFDWLGQAMASAAAWLFEAVWPIFDTITLVDVTSPEYIGVYNVLFGVAIFIMLVFFCLQLITGPHPPRPYRPVPRRPGTREIGARVVPGHHPHRAAAGSHRPARGRDRAGHRKHDGRDGQPRSGSSPPRSPGSTSPPPARARS